MTDKNSIISSFGLDISSTTIQWEGWSPNKKYTQKISISNLNTKTVNIKIKSPPKSQNFKINENSNNNNNNNNKFIKIRGGHSKKIIITFLPSQIQNYSDDIVLSIISPNTTTTTTRKDIKISLTADIPKTCVDIPSEIDFGFIAVKEESILNFEMINHGDIQISYKWITNKSPLIFEPCSGVITSKNTQNITIKYTPKIANCIEMKVPCCIYDDRNELKKQEIMYMTIKAMCTYPFFKISSKIVDMGAISIGDCKKKKLRIENCSPVCTVINIKNQQQDKIEINDKDMESVFNINPNADCKIEANGFIEIDISFKPRTVGIKYTQHCEINTKCGYKVNFVINGKADSPKITSSINLINFKCVEILKYKKSVFTLTNHSIIDSHFDFINIGEYQTSKSSFILQPKRGKIKSNESIDIIVKFKPNNPMLYNKKIFCIIHHHIPLFIQLIGCGIDDKTKFILQPQFKQVENEINEQLSKEKNNADKLGINHTNMSHKLFSNIFEDYSLKTQKYIKSSTNIIEFESCSLSQGIAPYHDITLFNKDTANIMSIKWDVESSKTTPSKAAINTDKKNEFAVFPPFMDIRSLSSADFSAAFQPSQDLMYFYDKIDCYYHYKNHAQKSLQLNCISIDLFGNSFAKSSKHFPVNIKLSTDIIEFTPCSLGSAIYATLKIRNLSSEYPTIWKINAPKKEPTSKSNFNSPSKADQDDDQKRTTTTTEQEQDYKVSDMFSFNPTKGYIPPNEFQLIVARFEPLKKGTVTFNTNIIFNENDEKSKIMQQDNDENNLRSLQLIGVAVEPKLHINNEIFVIPTCIGMSSYEYIELYNSSPIPINYKWKIPEKYAKDAIITIEPLQGILDINEKKKAILKFSPIEIAEKYVIECQCFYTAVNEKKQDEDDDDVESAHFSNLRINACCNQSIVEFIPKQSDFGSILIDCQTTKSVLIQNNADCKLNCDFYLEPVNYDQSDDEKKTKLEISPFINNCSIPPKTRKQLELNINAIYPGIHEYKLIAKVKRIDGRGSIESYSMIKFNAIWPTLNVTDIECNDDILLLNKENLWSLFSINSLNKAFKSDLSKFERDWNNVNIEKKSHDLQVDLTDILENKFINIDFNFGAKQLKYRETTEIYVNVCNQSSISAVINLKYLPQLLCKPENWVENNKNINIGQNEDEEEYNDLSEDDHLFDVEPKHFELEPNKSKIITFTYHHKICGEHATKILLSIQNGKQITLNLFGETITSNYHPRMSIKYKNIHLKSQQIGLLDKQIITQFIPIYNLCAHDLIYSVDTSSIRAINEENYNFKIFEIDNEYLQGIIKKKSCIFLKIKFHPIEIKQYMFNLRINAEIDDRDIENPEATFINIPIIANGVDIYAETQSTKNHENYICFGRSYDQNDIIKLPECHVRLSTQVLKFGIIPLRANARRIIMIHNEQNQYPVHYHWEKVKH